MTLDKFTQLSYFEIYGQRYSTNDVLLMKRKAGTHNKIVFTKSKSQGTAPYYISGNDLKRCKIEPKMSKSGQINDFYVVPLDALEPLEINERSNHEIW